MLSFILSLTHSRDLVRRKLYPLNLFSAKYFWNLGIFLFWDSLYCGPIGKLIKQIACKRVIIKIVCRKIVPPSVFSYLEIVCLSQIDFQINMLININ